MYPDAAKVSRQILRPFWKPPSAHAAANSSLSPDDLQRRYLAAVLNYAAVRVGSSGEAEAEDITAEVFAAAFAAPHRCPTISSQNHQSGDDPIRAWLFGIARRKLADSFRRRTRRPRTALLPGHPAPANQGPEPQFLRSEAAQMLQTILSKLPELQREALLLRYIDEMSLIEIGLVLGKSPNAIAQLLHRARQTARTHGAAYFDMIPGFNNDEEVTR